MFRNKIIYFQRSHNIIMNVLLNKDDEIIINAYWNGGHVSYYKTCTNRQWILCILHSQYW